jgi:hypothetical protein
LTKEGIAMVPGPPYTPQSQGLVERANGVFKRLMGKTLRSLRLPPYLWPALTPGVVQTMNSLVNSTTKESPHKRAGRKEAHTIPDIMLGDVVSIVDPKKGRHDHAIEGYYGGCFADNNVSVVVRASGGGWRYMRVHPKAVKLIAWQGKALPQPYNAKDEVKTVADIEYEAIDGDMYGDVGIAGEEEPGPNGGDGDHDYDQEPHDGKKEEVLGPGSGVLVRESAKEAPYIARVFKAHKKKVLGAKLEKSNGKWEPSELVSFKRDQVERCFPLSGGDEMTKELDKILQGEQREEEDDGSPKVVVEVDENSDDDKSDQAQGEVAEALAAKVPILPENKAKNQVEATKDDIAKGSHINADMKELKNFIDLKVLGPKVKGLTRDILALTFDAGWRRTFKGSGDDRVAKSRLYAKGYLEMRVLGWLETYSGTMEQAMMMIGIIYALFRKWPAAKGDVNAAPRENQSFL